MGWLIGNMNTNMTRLTRLVIQVRTLDSGSFVGGLTREPKYHLSNNDD